MDNIQWLKDRKKFTEKERAIIQRAADAQEQTPELLALRDELIAPYDEWIREDSEAIKAYEAGGIEALKKALGVD